MQGHLTTRRLFLQRGLALLAAVPTIPSFLDQTVMAVANPLDVPLVQQPSGKDGKILVIVQLAGGNDGLNTVVPYADDEYHRARPGLRLGADEVLKINDHVGLHPNLASLAKLYEQGNMAIVQGVGYPNPNRSHFRSMDVWHTAIPEEEMAASGWVGRYFDNTCNGSDPHVGINIGQNVPLAMQGERITPLSFARPENYRYKGTDTTYYQALNAAPDRSGDSGGAWGDGSVAGDGGDSALDFLHRTAMDAQVSSDKILSVTQNHRRRPGEYPGGEFGEGLRMISAMIGGGLPTRVYYVSLGGFDTHANQRGRHEQLMTRFAQGVGAFWEDLREQGNADRVLMMSFSEFGRRVRQNASGGTDHGTAAPVFLFGENAALQSGIWCRHPSLTDLDNGDLRYGVDFRSVYAAILQNWLDAPAAAVLGKQFDPLPVLRS